MVLISGFIMLTIYQTINLPTRRENLDSTLKCSYPFVTPSIKGSVTSEFGVRDLKTK